MSHDPTEDVRREMVNEINSNSGERAELEQRYGRVWNTQELTRDFDVQGFMAPFVVVRRKSDGMAGTLEFQHMPRYYFSFREDK